MSQSLETAAHHHRAGQLTEAEAVYREVLAREPLNADALHLLGVIAHQSGRPAEAIELIARAVALNDAIAPYHYNLGEAHRAAGDAQAALPHFARAIELRPAYADAYNNLGRALEMLGRPMDARAMYRQAIVSDPAHVKAHFNLGLVSLLLGDYETGWREYEWRLRIAEPVDAGRLPDTPSWDGGNPAGKTILVRCEQGLGDCIQFARYLPLLIGRGAHVVLTCPQPLLRLFESLPSVRVIVDANPLAQIPRADRSVFIGSLPLMFGTTPATIPTFAAYLRPPIAALEAWREQLRPLRAAGHRLVGLVWAGNPAQVEDRWRSLTLAQLIPLGDIRSVTLISLQEGSAAAQVNERPGGLNVVDLSAHLHDLAETAAIMSQLDLVIATDTAVAHLAGALANPYGRWSASPQTGAGRPSPMTRRGIPRCDFSASRHRATGPRWSRNWFTISSSPRSHLQARVSPHNELHPALCAFFDT
jgi:Tfp pilus assembly protein PilF